MCGRYSLAMRPSRIRSHLVTDLHLPVSSSPSDEGDDAPRRTHNFAPTYRGVVYRADVPDGGFGREDRDAGAGKEGGGDGEGQEGGEEGQGGGEEGGSEEIQYKLQTMKWGLIPSWTKRAPDFSGTLKTINCRSESLLSSRSMWSSMKQRKRCVVLVEGFYEWLNRGGVKVPHYVKRKDGGMMCFAGLWDCVRYPATGGEGEDGEDGEGKGGEKGEKVYTYTIVTRPSNAQLSFLHDRMPVMLEPGSEAMWRWLDPKRGWGDEVASCLKGEEGELECYEVDRGVGKVGRDEEYFVVPVKERKGGIEGFFGKKEKKEEGVKKEEEIKDEGVKREEVKDEGVKKEEEDRKYDLRNETEAKKEEPNEGDIKMESIENDSLDSNNEHKTETPKKEEDADEPTKKEDPDTKTPKKEPLSPLKKEDQKQGIKREHDDSLSLDKAEPVKKATRTSTSPVKTRSAVKNDRGVVVQKTTPKKGEKGVQKITGFFGKK